MDDIKTSPAPWKAECGGVFDAEGLRIADFLTVYDIGDARLAAAAPELRDALEGMMSLCVDTMTVYGKIDHDKAIRWMNGCKPWTAALAAIKKAGPSGHGRCGICANWKPIPSCDGIGKCGPLDDVSTDANNFCRKHFRPADSRPCEKGKRRPFTADELDGLIGKIVVFPEDYGGEGFGEMRQMIIGRISHPSGRQDVMIGTLAYFQQDLMKGGAMLDGEPWGAKEEATVDGSTISVDDVPGPLNVGDRTGHWTSDWHADSEK